MAGQISGATIAQRPQPQTTQQAGGPGPFISHAVHASRPGFVHAGVPYGGVVTDPLPQAPGYLRKLRFGLIASAGGTGTTISVTADMTQCVAQAVQLLQLKDPMGTPIITGSGFDMLYLAPLFSGQVGILRAEDVTLFPTYTPVTSGTNLDTGNFGADLFIPFEGTLAYGLIAVGNASALPTLLVNMNTTSQVYGTTSPNGNPTIAVSVDYDYYAVADPSVEPPGLGTTFQWQSVPANPTIGSAASQRVQLPRTAGYLHTLILVLRDSTGARIDGYGSRIRLYVDGVPVYDDSFAAGPGAARAAGTSSHATTRMFLESGGNLGQTIAGANSAVPTLRPTGVLAFSWRESIAQVNLGLADTQLRLPPITPGTLIEIECTPWATIANAPAVLTAIYGMVIPRGLLVTGLPQEGV